MRPRAGRPHWATAAGTRAAQRPDADPDTSDAAALAAIDGRFPAATLARLEFTGAWTALETASLVDVRLP